jgi:hypothetical protein
MSLQGRPEHLRFHGAVSFVDRQSSGHSAAERGKAQQKSGGARSQLGETSKKEPSPVFGEGQLNGEAIPRLGWTINTVPHN